MVFKPRISGASLYHHIYAWGNDRHPIFKTDTNYRQYLKLLRKYSSFFEIEIIAYALMEWHVHLFIHDLNNKLSDFILNLHGGYARYFNHMHNRVGHVFGRRFNNRIVQPNNYALWLTRYIHRQAVEAGLVKNLCDYPWTSYKIYIGLEPNRFLKTDIILKQFGEGVEAFRRYENFILSDKFGLVEWEKTRQQIIGERDFIKEVATRKNIQFEERIEKPKIEEVINEVLGLDIETLIKPKGRKARLQRHEVIRILRLEYKYRQSDIARTFNVSVAAVSKVLNKESSKVKS